MLESKVRLEAFLLAKRERAEKSNSCLAEIVDDGGLKLDYLSPTPLRKKVCERVHGVAASKKYTLLLLLHGASWAQMEILFCPSD